ncbi:MAG: endonuclease/exonuclease/phosphatase family protein [Casimicrobium sp.]
MKLITWNIQWGLGQDGRVDLNRIARTAREIADFDVLCLQEISDNYGALLGNDGSNQFSTLRSLFPDYTAIEGVAVDRHTEGVGRQRFGNMIFSRYPVIQALHHQLPWPAEAANVPTMPRMALEAVLKTPMYALRVTTTHLEFYSSTQRLAQADALRATHGEAYEHASDREQAHKVGSPFETRPRGTHAVLTGDFNCQPDDEALARLTAPIDAIPSYVDAWQVAHSAIPHTPTVGLDEPPDRWRCLDYVFVSENLTSAVRALDVITSTRASDHQPLLLEIAS